MIAFSGSAIAQTTVDKPEKAIVLKTNALNILFIPSIHGEFQVAKKFSVQANVHRVRYTFMSTSQLLNMSMDARYYIVPTKNKQLAGLYVLGGMALSHDYDAWRTVDSVSIPGGTSMIGPMAKIGYQMVVGQKQRLYLDANLGFAAFLWTTKRNDYFNGEQEGRIFLGAGYRIWP
ncbi:MAG: hypothetical protein RL660_1281 [Bacteroidota bacterium]